jgi:hypothetical protein
MEVVEVPVPAHFLVHAANSSGADQGFAASYGKSVKDDPGADGRRVSGRGFA